MDLINKAAQLNISHFTVHDFVNEIERLRKIESAAKGLLRNDKTGYIGDFWDAYDALVKELKQLAEARKLLATRVEASRLDEAMDKLVAMTKERDELLEICVGLSKGTDWNNGTHAKIYRPKLIAKVFEMGEKL